MLRSGKSLQFSGCRPRIIPAKEILGWIEKKRQETKSTAYDSVRMDLELGQKFKEIQEWQRTNQRVNQLKTETKISQAK